MNFSVVKNFFSTALKTKPVSLNLSGPFKTYHEALSLSHGYNEPVILKKVLNASISLLEGEAMYERDGTGFAMRPTIDNFRRLLRSHLKEHDVVVDFGGGLGGGFINNRDLFKPSNSYTVVEQSIFAEAGRSLSLKYNLQIQFIDDLCHLLVKPDIIVFSSVLQYIPNAEQVLRKSAELMPRLIIIDRTAFAPNNSSQKWWIQNEQSYYGIPISYPNRPLSIETILSFFGQYSVLDKWTNPFDPDVPAHGGFLLCRFD